MSEENLVRQCAPTLAGIKTGTIFPAPFTSLAELTAEIRELNRILVPKGLRLLPLRCQAGRALLYLYRPSQLQADLDCPGVGELLARYGYESTRAEDALSRLCQRLEEQGGFPHEIGLFLGYPLGDVEGFIRNRGQNCKCAGCWKVYCNELEAQKRFARIQKCRKVYARLWAQGRSVWQLTVAA